LLKPLNLGAKAQNSQQLKQLSKSSSPLKGTQELSEYLYKLRR